MLDVAEANDQIDLRARVVERLGLRISNRHAQAAADNRRTADAVGMAGARPSGPTKSSSASPSLSRSSFSVV